MRLITGGPLVVVCLALAGAPGCGGSDSNSASTAAATASQSRTTPSKPPVENAADQRIAEAGKLRLSDFPSGFVQSDESEDSIAGSCNGVEQAKNATNRHDDAPDFQKGDNTQATNTVYVYADEASAHSGFLSLSSRATRECISKQLSAYLAKQAKSTGPGDTEAVTIGKPTTGEVAIDAVGDEQSGGRVSVPVSSQGLDVDLEIDVVFVRVGRAVSALVFTDVPSPFDGDLRAQLTRKVARRLTAVTTTI